MANISAVISNIRNIMRQDRGISGDAQRLEQLGWMLFLKIMDDKDQELEILKDNYLSAIPDHLQWRNWATNKEGITGEELIRFIENELFPTLKTLTQKQQTKRAELIQEVFDGNKGEYYTPRAITRLMTQMTDPKLGEQILDPACGTDGFLTSAIDYVRGEYVKTVDDEQTLQQSMTGWELKPVAYVLGLTNLILHEMDVPDYHYIDSLKKEYNSIGKKDQMDVILANPPFGASIAEGVETNFPATYRCKESADLFVILMIQLFKAKGRAAIVLPDGSITGDGVKARIREKLLTECNLHTIIRLPQSTFFPATVSTNLLFFEKGTATKEIWYYEHKLPEGQKSYSKTKPIRFGEFQPIVDWWKECKETDVAWKVKVEDLTDWNLDIKNPTQEIVKHGDPNELYSLYGKSNTKIKSLILDITTEIISGTPIINKILENDISLFKNNEVVKQLTQAILQEAIQGKLTVHWRKQNPDAEPADELLKRIKAEKQKLIDAKKIRKEKPLPPITKDEIPFALPDGWVWCRLGDLCNTITKCSSPKWQGINYVDSYEKGILFITSKNVDNYKINLSKAIFVERDFNEIEPRSVLKKGDLLTNIVGASIGRTALYNLDYIANINQAVCILRIEHKHILKSFLLKLMNANFIIQLMLDMQFSPGRANLSMSNLAKFPIALPPLLEQKAIVKKVESLMQKCTTLETEIKQSEIHAEQLMQTVIKEAFESNKSMEVS